MVVLLFLWLAVFVVAFLAWFAILFTGRYPRGMFTFVVGVQRWTLRLHGYFASFHDEYPPFFLSADARKAEGTTTVVSGVVGGFVAAGVGVALIAALMFALEPEVIDVGYDRLERGSPAEPIIYGDGSGQGVFVQLTSVDDPLQEHSQFAKSSRDRAVVFEVGVWMFQGTSVVGEGDARLKFETSGGQRESVGRRRSSSTTARPRDGSERATPPQ